MKTNRPTNEVLSLVATYLNDQAKDHPEAKKLLEGLGNHILSLVAKSKVRYHQQLATAWAMALLKPAPEEAPKEEQAASIEAYMEEAGAPPFGEGEYEKALQDMGLAEPTSDLGPVVESKITWAKPNMMTLGEAQAAGVLKFKPPVSSQVLAAYLADYVEALKQNPTKPYPLPDLALPIYGDLATKFGIPEGDYGVVLRGAFHSKDSKQHFLLSGALGYSPGEETLLRRAQSPEELGAMVLGGKPVAHDINVEGWDITAILVPVHNGFCVRQWIVEGNGPSAKMTQVYHVAWHYQNGAWFKRLASGVSKLQSCLTFKLPFRVTTPPTWSPPSSCAWLTGSSLTKRLPTTTWTRRASLSTGSTLGKVWPSLTPWVSGSFLGSSRVG